MNEVHFKILEKIVQHDGIELQWAGANIRSWWDYVTHSKRCNLLDQKVSRRELKKICHADSDYTDEECIAAVMAWGGQNRKHGRTLFSRVREVEPIISGLRGQQLSTWDAYVAFDGIWKSGTPLGMGAAYFTKLIFFCEPSHKGYIMDQWTSKSVNLLSGSEIVHLQYGHVSKKNTIKNYMEFCSSVEEISKELGVSGEEAEIAIFSRGGRNKAPWRQYVVENFR